MRYLLGFILLSVLGIHHLLGNIVATRDSLLNVIKESADISQQIATYRNLADLYFEKPEEINYLNKMYLTAKAVDDKANMFEALVDLSFSHIKTFNPDSVLYYMHIIEECGDPEETIPFLSYLRMRLFEGRIRQNEREKGVEDELYFLNNTAVDKNNIYIQINEPTLPVMLFIAKRSLRRQGLIWTQPVNLPKSCLIRRDLIFVY